MPLVKFNKFEKLHEDQTAQAIDAKVAVIDKEASKPDSKYITSDFRTIFNDLRDYVTKDIIKKKKPSLLVTGAPGVGKCMRAGDKILMHDLTIKKVENVVVGDFLMGDDSVLREVLSLSRGRDQMYEIKPTKGESIFVNGEHILCLMRSDNRNTKIEGCENKDGILEISVNDYLKCNKSTKACLKLYHIGLDFDYQQVSINPYWLGLWLGDGSSNTSGLTISKKDVEILEFHKEYSESLGLQVHSSKDDLRYGNNCNVFTPVANNYKEGRENFKFNVLLNNLRTYDLSGPIGSGQRKRIPKEYLLNDRETRLQLLAGIIDSDGGKATNGCYDICLKWESLIDDIALLARSLGYMVTKSIKKCTIKSIGFVGYYHRLSISGAHDLPCRLPRKQSTERKQIKNVLRTGFEVIPVGEDNYYGFTITGNGRYLMHDLLVTHNTYIVNEEIKKAGLIEDKDYVEIGGKSTALAMYISLYENNGKLIIYDDCDSIFKDDDALNVLKNALELSGKRNITWGVSKAIKGIIGQTIPNKFEFTGQVIFISNISQKAMDMALKSRSLKIEIALTTEGMIEYIKSIINHVEPDKPIAIKEFTLNLIQAVSKKNEFVRIDVRNFIKAIGITEDEDPKDPNYKENIMRKIGQQCDERSLLK